MFYLLGFNMIRSLATSLEHADYSAMLSGRAISDGGAQWLSGRVLDSKPKGRGFEPHRRHSVVVLKQDTFILA